MLKPKYIFIILISLITTSLAWALSWQDLWLNDNQQGVKLLQLKHNNQALAKLTQPAWRGIAYYNESNYTKAYGEFSKNNSATSLYNQGNALAQLHKYHQAIAKYQQALKLQNNNPDAKYNIKLLESILKQQQKSKSQQSNKQSDSKQSKDNNQQSSNEQKKDNQSSNKAPKQDQTNNGQNKEQKSQQGSSKSNKDSGASEANKQSKDNKAATPSNNNEQKGTTPGQDAQPQPKQANDKLQADKPGSQKDASDALSNATKVPNKAVAKPTATQQGTPVTSEQKEVQRILSKVPDDPGGLLRNKFIRDYQRQQRGNND